MKDRELDRAIERAGYELGAALRTVFESNSYVERDLNPSNAADALCRIADGLSTLNSRLSDLDQQICMGIRFGLFGFGAEDSSSILELDVNGQLADLNELLEWGIQVLVGAPVVMKAQQEGPG